MYDNMKLVEIKSLMSVAAPFKSIFKVLEGKPKTEPVLRTIIDNEGRTKNMVGDYELSDVVLGEGGIGSVYLGYESLTRTPVAIKQFRRSSLGRTEVEVQLMRQANHKNIPKVFNFYQTEKGAYLVQEYIEGVELFEMLQNLERCMSEERIWKIFSQIVETVEHLHSKSIIHNDLKIENILIDKNDKITLIDFGHSFINGSDVYPGHSTIEYTSPEALLSNNCNFQSEVWSLGVILFIMLFGIFPFDGTQDEIFSGIINGKCKYSKNPISREVYDLLNKMIVVDPKDRIELSEIKNHPWCQQFESLN